MTKNEQGRLLTSIVRYGLPAIVLIFYLTAVRRFDYTPDSTYSSAIVAQNLVLWGAFALPPTLTDGATPSPLWAFLQVAGYRASIDPILFAKVFGLFFSCVVLVFAYLLATEVTEDRLLAFAATFVMGTQAWFLYLAPTGSAIPVVIALMLGCLFFLLRNEYIVAALLAGLLSLLFWGGAVLFGVLLLDLAVNAMVRARAFRMGVLATLAYAVVVGPWIVICARRGIPVLPVLVPLGNVPNFGIPAAAGLVLLAVLAVAGLLLSLRSGLGWVHIRTHGAVLIWSCLVFAGAFAGSWELFTLAVPLLTVGAFVGVQRGAPVFGRPEAGYALALIVVVIMLLLNQVSLFQYATPSMEEAREKALECNAVGAWIHSHCSDSLRIVSDRPGEIGYRSGLYVFPLADGPADILVTSQDTVRGYSVLYRPPADEPRGERSIAVWKRLPQQTGVLP